MSKKNKKINVVYSTNPDYDFDYEQEQEDETLPPSKQHLKVFIDRKNRNGKEVTVVSGFIGSDEDLKTLGKTLKTRCGVGGTQKDGEILIQGSFKEKIHGILHELGYHSKMAGG